MLHYSVTKKSIVITVTHYKVRHPCNKLLLPVNLPFILYAFFLSSLLLLCFIFIVPYFLPSFYFGDEDECGDTILRDALMKEEIYCG